MPESVFYQWKWMRGEKLTVKCAVGDNRVHTFEPVTNAGDGTVIAPISTDPVYGVALYKADAADDGVPVIVSRDVYECQLAAGEAPVRGEAVVINADFSVSKAGGWPNVGRIVDYDPIAGGICHVLLRPRYWSAGRGT